MDISSDNAVITGKYRAQQKFIENLYTLKWKRQLSQNEKPKWLSEKHFLLYQSLHTKQPQTSDRAILLTISPGYDPSQRASIIAFLETVLKKLLTYKNFIPDTFTYAIEELTKTGEPTHPHLHLTFPNVYGHSKTQYINRTFNAMQQIRKATSPSIYLPDFSRQSVDVTNHSDYETYKIYVTKNVNSMSREPEFPLRTE